MWLNKTGREEAQLDTHRQALGCTQGRGLSSLFHPREII